jgi:hypothetical protein
VGARIENIHWELCTIKVLGKGDKERLAPLSRKTIDSLRACLGAFPHIAKSGPLFRAQLPEQQGGIQLQGQTWIAFYRENRTFPNDTVKRILSGKTVGMIGPRKRTGPKPNATITIAADLQRRSRSWPLIFRAVSHGVEMSPAQRHALQAVVYYLLPAR